MSEKYNIRSFLRDIIPLAVAAAVLITSSLSNTLSIPLTLRGLGFVVTIGLLSALVSVILTKRIVDLTYRGVINELLGDFQALDKNTSVELKKICDCINSLRSLLSQGRILTDDYIAQIESSVPECSEVWVITPDLHKDIPTAGAYCFDNIVRENITKRNVNYTYLIPNEPIIRQRAQRIKSTCPEEHQDKVKIITLNHELWERLPYTGSDLAIYNPLETNSQPSALVFELPTGKRDQWIQADDTLTDLWSREVSKIIEQATAKPLLSAGDSSHVKQEAAPTREKEKEIVTVGKEPTHNPAK